MIRTLRIHNVALIEQIQIDFHNGLQVLSGETGAGKSIIVDAITLILGGRADRDLIRSGCERASVEAEFETQPDSRLAGILEREGIERDGNYLSVFRDISINGRNTCRINGVMVPVAVLKETAPFLLNLHGQSEHQFLADEEKHLAYLDMMGSDAHQNLILCVRDAYRDFITNHRYYARLVKMNETRDRRMDILRRELEELRTAGIREGEENRLEDESRKLQKALRVHDKINHILMLLGNEEGSSDSLYNFQSAAKEMANLSQDNPAFGGFASRCENLYYELEEILYGIKEIKNRYDFDPAELEKTETRLESVRKMLRKYGPSEEDVLKSQEEMETEYKTLTELDLQIKDTGSEHKKLLAAYRAKAKALTESRREIAARFEQLMMSELKDLGMEHTVFKAAFEENTGKKPIMPSPNGDDRIVFMISPNPGEPLKPLSRIASGGELSRLMLALKTIEAGRGGGQTMIFDEIDTGISGRMAQAVAEKMLSISGHQQVLCISHLPQIAAAADNQYLIFKYVREGRTVTEAKELGREQRIEEIARMISGAKGITAESKQYAEQMISASGSWKHGK